MPVSYDFKRASRETPRRSNGGRRLRFFVLLCVVAAVTAGVMMLIVPDKAPAAESEANKNAPEKSEKSSAGVDSGEVKNEVSSPSGDTSHKNDATVTSDNGSGNETSAKDTSGKSTGNTGKGVVQGGDLPPDADVPEFRNGQAPGMKEALAQSAASNDIDAQAAVLRDFLMKEYSAGGEFSANWNSVGVELAAAIRHKWQQRKWQNDSISYKVVARDNLIKISRRNSTTVEGIKFINRLKKDDINIGQRLTIIPGPWQVSISRKARLLNVWRKEKNAWRIFAVFQVGVGRNNRTPNGSFKIWHRARHPKWYGPDGRIFAYGDKENPLGDYFLKLLQVEPGGAKKDRGYGIHGSSDDSSVGRSLSNGCIRMRNQDVEILYYLLPDGCPVKIVD